MRGRSPRVWDKGGTECEYRTGLPAAETPSSEGPAEAWALCSLGEPPPGRWCSGLLKAWPQGEAPALQQQTVLEDGPARAKLAASVSFV